MEMATLLIALAALVTSVVSVLELRRQRQNDVRPVLVVLEKNSDAEGSGSRRSLYLVNMGQAVALNIKVLWNAPEGLRTARYWPPRLQTEIAAGRRALLAEGYGDDASCVGRLELVASYTDVNGQVYRTRYTPGSNAAGEHSFEAVASESTRHLVEYQALPRMAA